MRNLITLLTVASLALLVGASEPQSKPARTALEKYTAAKAKADADYQARMQTLNRQLHTELQAAIKAATRSGDLDEANAIKSVMERMFGITRFFRIEANKNWQPTVEVSAGDELSIEAEGQWGGGRGIPSDIGPGGSVYQGKPMFYLEGRIGAQTFRVGQEATLTASAAGVLELRMRDTAHSDNTGFMSAAITVRPHQKP